MPDSSFGFGTTDSEEPPGNGAQHSFPTPQPVPQWQATTVPASRHCPTCGIPVVPTAAICPRCGTAIGSPRNKGIAVLLAVFFGCWTWLYTYQQDKAKFWWGLALNIVGIITAAFLVGFVIIFGVWIWAIVATATKPEQVYQSYPNV